MRIIFIGDVVGKIGQDMIHEYLPQLKQHYKPQVTIVNGENATVQGKGITEKIYKQLLQDGADCVTMGNHTFDNREIFQFINQTKKLLRPANYPPGTAGKGYTIFQVNQIKFAVINLQGRALTNPTLDDPFQIIDEILKEVMPITHFIFVDFHAETTSEKIAIGWYLDGKVSAVVGTHTHVQTNDARILPQGTAYLTDVGMTGSYDGVLGVKRDRVIEKFKTQLPTRFEVVETGAGQISGCYLELSDKTGQAKQIKNFVINPDHPSLL